MLQHMNHSIKNLEELLPDSCLSLNATSAQSSKVMDCLDTITAKRALEPLKQVEESGRAEAQIQSEVQQVETS